MGRYSVSSTPGYLFVWKLHCHRCGNVSWLCNVWLSVLCVLCHNMIFYVFYRLQFISCRSYSQKLLMVNLSCCVGSQQQHIVAWTDALTIFKSCSLISFELPQFYKPWSWRTSCLNKVIAVACKSVGLFRSCAVLTWLSLPRHVSVAELPVMH